MKRNHVFRSSQSTALWLIVVGVLITSALLLPHDVSAQVVPDSAIFLGTISVDAAVGPSVGLSNIQIPSDGILAAVLRNPDSSRDGVAWLIVSSPSSGWVHEFVLPFGDSPLQPSDVNPFVRPMSQGKSNVVGLTNVLSSWGALDFGIIYFASSGGENHGTNFVDFFLIPNSVVSLSGALELATIVSEPFDANTVSATFFAPSDGWIVTWLNQPGFLGGGHGTYVDGIFLHWIANSFDDANNGTPNDIVASFVIAGSHQLTIRHEDSVFGDNSGTRISRVFFLPFDALPLILPPPPPGDLAQCQQELADAQAQIAQLQQEVQDLQSQLAQLTTALVSGLTSLQNDLRVVFKDPAFVIPGATPLEQYQNLITAILNLNKGRKQGIYQNLGGK